MSIYTKYRQRHLHAVCVHCLPNLGRQRRLPRLGLRGESFQKRLPRLGKRLPRLGRAADDEDQWGSALLQKSTEHGEEKRLPRLGRLVAKRLPRLGLRSIGYYLGDEDETDAFDDVETRASPFPRLGLRAAPVPRLGKRASPFPRLGQRASPFPRLGDRASPFPRLGRSSVEADDDDNVFSEHRTL